MKSAGIFCQKMYKLSKAIMLAAAVIGY